MSLLRPRVPLLMALVAFAWALPAAADVFTAPVLPSTGRYVSCHIVNVGKKDLEVTIEILTASNGNVLDSFDTVVSPGRSAEWSYAGLIHPQYCAFRGRFTAKTVRASALLVDQSTAATHVAVPAQ